MKYQSTLTEILVTNLHDKEYSRGLVKKNGEKAPIKPPPDDPNEVEFCDKCGNMMPPGSEPVCPECHAKKAKP